MDYDREWQRTLEALLQGDDEVARDAAAEYERATLRKPAWRHDVRSAFVEMPDGSLIDRDELVRPTDPEA